MTDEVLSTKNNIWALEAVSFFSLIDCRSCMAFKPSGVAALSNPKNVRLAVEGIARISGDTEERTEILEKDENDVPKILTMIYHELFPTFFLLSKTMNVSSPPHTIGEMGNSPIESDDSVESESAESQTADDLPEELLESPSEPSAESPSDSIKSPDIAQPGV